MASGIIELEDGWTRIKLHGIDKLERILEGDMGLATETFSKKEYAVLYTLCYHMCTQRTPYNWSEQLYARHAETFRIYLTTKVVPALRRQHDRFLLAELSRRWDRHKLMNKWMNRFFMYLNRYHVDHYSLPTLEESGLAAFKRYVFDAVKSEVTAAMLAQIERDREGELVDRALLRQCVEVYEAMGMGVLEVYRNELERPLLAETRAFYARKAEEWSATDSTPDYLCKAEAAIVAEALRVESYLLEVSESPLLRKCEEVLLKDREAELLEKEGSGLRVLLRDKRRDDLSRLFRLFSRVDEGLTPIARIVREHLQEAGLQVIRQRESAVAAAGGKETGQETEFVVVLLNLHEEARELVQTQFGANTLFQKALKDAFEVFVNKEVESKYSTTEMIANHCDKLLRAGGERLNDEEVERELVRLVRLFAFVIDKDRFGEIYRNQLARRLLNNKSSSSDAERSMISKLKMQCGAQYTSKMEGMLADLQLGQEQGRQFRKWYTDGAASAPSSSSSSPSSSSTTAVATRPPTLPFEFNTLVLTTGWWPTFKDVTLALPLEFTRCEEVFRAYYDSKTTNRKLVWCYSQGTVVMRACFRRDYELSLTTMQAAALLLFNHEASAGPSAAAAAGGGGGGGGGSGGERVPLKRLDFAEMRRLMNADEDVTKKVLHSLSCGKYRILNKLPDGKTIGTADEFVPNMEFSCATLKVRIPMALLEESHNPKKVEDDRRNAIDAAIVRTMKSAKTMSHQDLFAAVLRQLQMFKPNPKLIKRRIEHCIDCDYMERDAEDPNLYRYLA